MENVINLSIEKRYNYFISRASEYEEIWGLYDNGWAVLSNNEGKQIIPFWPESEFAAICSTDQWKGYTPKSISLNDFMEKWLPGMQKDKRLSNIFYVPLTKVGLVIEPEVLLNDLKEALENYM